MSEEGYYASFGMGAVAQPQAFKNPPPICTDPDRRPDQSGYSVDTRGDAVLGVYNVKGLGALLFRGVQDPLTGLFEFKGISTFSQEQIRRGEL